MLQLVSLPFAGLTCHQCHFLQFRCDLGILGSDRNYSFHHFRYLQTLQGLLIGFIHNPPTVLHIFEPECQLSNGVVSHRRFVLTGPTALQELIRQLGHYDGVAIVKLNFNFIIR